jgi:hypothetical protein
MNETTDLADPRQRRRPTYLLVGIVVLAPLVVALAVHRSRKVDAAAHQKAGQLVAAFHRAGLSAPDQAQIARLLGDDGGAVCRDPANALEKAVRDGLGSNGAAGPGQRPVPIDPDLVEGEKLILQVYCPDELPGFVTYVNGLETAGSAHASRTS